MGLFVLLAEGEQEIKKKGGAGSERVIQASTVGSRTEGSS